MRPGGVARVEDFCAGPLRAQLMRSFRNFPEQDVEDALSFALEQGLHAPRRGTSEGEVFSWLRTTMLRRLGRERERQGRVVAASGEGIELELVASALPGPEEELIAKERCEAVAELVDALPETTRAVLRARYFEGLDRRQAAAATGLSERQVKRHVERAMDAVEQFVLGRLGAVAPCADGRRAVLAYAKGHAPAAVAARARHHLTGCERCRTFHGELRAVRWGAAAATPVPALAGDGSALGTALERAAAVAASAKQQLYALGGRADAAALGGVRGPGAAATALTCAALGTAGGATYCVTYGFPEPVRELVGADRADAREEPAASPAPAHEPPPVATDVAVPAAPVQTTPAPQAAPAPTAPPPPPREHEFTFERTAASAAEPAESSAAASPAPPARPAAAPAEGGGEFGP